MIRAVCYTLSNINGGVDPMGHIRLFAPLEKANILLIPGIEGDNIFPERVSDGDIVVIQRHFPVKFMEYQKIIDRAHQEKKPVVFEIDDLLFNLPMEHPDRIIHFYAAALLPIFQAILEADIVTVPTDKLAVEIQPYNSRVFVLPNYFDDDLWSLRKPNLYNDISRLITIGYMGTNSHLPDLEYLVPVILEIINRYPQMIRFRIWGIKPPDILLSFDQIEWVPWISYNYKEFSTYFQKQSVDIWIAPLIDNLFNQCKSPLKFFEYSSLGAPGVYSAIETYNKIIKNGINGFLASSYADWRDSLINLIENPVLRYEMALNAQETIKTKWLLSKNAYRWEEVYQQAIERYPHEKKHKEMDLKIINSLSYQIVEAFQYKDSRI
ncbi:MAG: hypothetical protein ACPL0B_00960, partial [Anaerolineales bacterium]